MLVVSLAELDEHLSRPVRRAKTNGSRAVTGMLSELSLAALTDELVRSVSAAIWEASSGLAGNSGDEKRRLELLRAVQARLVCKHPELIVREIATKKKRAADRPVAKRSSKLMRQWRPTRPKLALAAAQLLQADGDVVKAPEKQRDGCLMPFKIFANTIAHQLDAFGMTSGYSHSSVVHAVTEVITAVFAEAEAIASAQEEGGACLELHSSTDAAWRGTAARGAGIAMNDAGRAVVVEASFKVASRLADELHAQKAQT